MAQWNISLTKNKLVLDYVPHPCDANGVVRECGEGDPKLMDDLLAFVVEISSPLDLVRTPDGRMFLRQMAAVE